MGRVGLRTVLHWSVCPGMVLRSRVSPRTALRWSAFFCAAFAAANIPAAFAQTHPPKIAPPASNSALNSTRDPAPAMISPPEEPAAAISGSPSAPAATNGAANPSELRADDRATHISDSPSAHATDEPPAPASDAPADLIPADGLPLAGARGVTHPVCLRCPPAQYSYPALIHKVQGNVTLDAIVGTDGWVSKVRILGSLRSGLDEQAMKAVRTWQWEPARDAEGKAVPAHQTVVVTFRIPK